MCTLSARHMHLVKQTGLPSLAPHGEDNRKAYSLRAVHHLQYDDTPTCTVGTFVWQALCLQRSHADAICLSTIREESNSVQCCKNVQSNELQQDK